jgi:hypothetical protein
MPMFKMMMMMMMVMNEVTFTGYPCKQDTQSHPENGQGQGGFESSMM